MIHSIKSKTPQQLLVDGWQDITDPRMAANTTSIDLYNSETGFKIRFDKGVEGASGFEAYLDIEGNMVGKGSKSSHIVIGGEN